MPDRILIVDDERLIRWTLTEALRGWGYQPLEAANARAAREVLAKDRPRAVLLDINLPDGSGLYLLRELKTYDPPPVAIMITANVLVDETIAALRAGAYDFVGKPLNLEYLRETIANAVRGQESANQPIPNRTTEDPGFGFDQIIGSSAAMTEMKMLAEKIALSGARASCFRVNQEPAKILSPARSTTPLPGLRARSSRSTAPRSLEH